MTLGYYFSTRILSIAVDERQIKERQGGWKRFVHLSDLSALTVKGRYCEFPLAYLFFHTTQGLKANEARSDLESLLHAVIISDANY